MQQCRSIRIDEEGDERRDRSQGLPLTCAHDRSMPRIATERDEPIVTIDCND